MTPQTRALMLRLARSTIEQALRGADVHVSEDQLTAIVGNATGVLLGVVELAEHEPLDVVLKHVLGEILIGGALKQVIEDVENGVAPKPYVSLLCAACKATGVDLNKERCRACFGTGQRLRL